MTEKSKAILNSVKTVSVLLVICLICGALLALCNNLFYVSPEEIQARAFQKYYPDFGSDMTKEEIDSKFSTLANGSKVEEVTKSSKGVYAIKATGTQGYKGTVTCYVFIAEEDGKAVVKAWANIDFKGETLMANFTDAHRKNWYVGKEINSDWNLTFEDEGFSLADTTLSSKAIANCLSVASYYAMNALGLGSNPEGEALSAINTLLGSEYGFAKVNDSAYVTAVGVDYYFEAIKDGIKYGAYTYAVDKAVSVAVVKGDLSNTDLAAEDVVASTDGFDATKLATIKSTGYLNFRFADSQSIVTEYANSDKWGSVVSVIKGADDSYTIRSAATGEFGDGILTIDVVIAGGKITGWTYVSSTNGADKYVETMIVPGGAETSWYNGADIGADIEMGSNQIAGATISSQAINNAINMACYYVRSISAQGGAN